MRSILTARVANQNRLIRFILPDNEDSHIIRGQAWRAKLLTINPFPKQHAALQTIWQALFRRTRNSLEIKFGAMQGSRDDSLFTTCISLPPPPPPPLLHAYWSQQKHFARKSTKVVRKPRSCKIYYCKTEHAKEAHFLTGHLPGNGY